jgi:acetoacetyl-CoA synthetase
MDTPRLLWTPSPETIQNSNLKKYMHWLAAEKNLRFNDYDSLWQWSVDNIDDFWQTIWEYFNIQFDGEVKLVTTDDEMPHVKWFEGTRLNYAEHVFRMKNDKIPAIVFKSEKSPIKKISWHELEQEVSSLQNFFSDNGVVTGDRIVAYMPCIPEASACLLAATSIGAVWSSCSPDFGTNAVIDRFVQIEPKVLIAVDSYSYGGKTFDKTEVVKDLVNAIPTIEVVIIISEKSSFDFTKRTLHWNDVAKNPTSKIKFTRVPFSHPIWVLYSSGTTGLPKAITHCQGGILLEHLKYGTFHNDFQSNENCFWYTTTGWMMWNYIHGALLAGATMVIYDGSPAYPDLNALWQFCEEAQINHFGTSAGFLLANLKANIKPKTFNLSALRSIGSTGSTLPPEGFDYVYEQIKNDVWLASMSGGTDVCSAFVGGNPTWAVYAGEIQCRALGCKLEAFDEEGNAMVETVGEMVITKPMPSMPIYFWNDLNFSRYAESYFEMYPGIWRHGDWTMVTRRNGVVIFGRSDATLNRGGVRIGTSEIYRAVDKVTEVKDSLIICIEKDGGEFWMPLFVVLPEGQALDETLKKKINSTIRGEYTPRHVPDEIINVPDVPYTISGKKTETPVKKVLMGKDPRKVVNAGALRNPQSMDFFIELYNKQMKN